MIFENYDRIVFAGDSVTDMGSAQPVGEGLFDNCGHGYVRMIENLLASGYPELKIRVTNSGCNGHNSNMLLDRYERDVLNLNPDWVSICIGINDVWRQFDIPAIREAHISPEKYRENMENMILATKDKVKGIFIITPYYIEPNREDPMRKRMDEYGAICRELAEKHGCIFVDFQTMFEKYCSVRHSSALAWDRVHPNEIGAMLMAREFLKHCDFDYNHML
ncbi:MAG: SGNH/GDSL hydrolase family protein [Oscillospiraceae bacterium]|nr:SGNH/GDSL hydrolase family protein [Oscillospiraceae bacterium]MBQ9938161.1 SGNH/GDSL hydrolase family protein [Oscillospiraceae bacterium]